MEEPKTTADGNFWDYISEKISDYNPELLDNCQDDFCTYLFLTKELSWDIPSALPCTHDREEPPMHHRTEEDIAFYRNRYPDLPNLIATVEWEVQWWKEATIHYKEVHGLDLTDTRINWSFDT